MRAVLERIFSLLWAYRIWWILPVLLTLTLLALVGLLADDPALVPFEYTDP